MRTDHGRYVRNVKVNDIQADEIWGFVAKKEAHKGPKEAHDNSIGDAYTFVAIAYSGDVNGRFRRDVNKVGAA